MVSLLVGLITGIWVGWNWLEKSWIWRQPSLFRSHWAGISSYLVIYSIHYTSRSHFLDRWYGVLQSLYTCTLALVYLVQPLFLPCWYFFFKFIYWCVQACWIEFLMKCIILMITIFAECLMNIFALRNNQLESPVGGKATTSRKGRAMC